MGRHFDICLTAGASVLSCVGLEMRTFLEMINYVGKGAITFFAAR